MGDQCGQSFKKVGVYYVHLAPDNEKVKCNRSEYKITSGCGVIRTEAVLLIDENMI